MILSQYLAALGQWRHLLARSRTTTREPKPFLHLQSREKAEMFQENPHGFMSGRWGGDEIVRNSGVIICLCHYFFLWYFHVTTRDDARALFGDCMWLQVRLLGDQTLGARSQFSCSNQGVEFALQCLLFFIRSVTTALGHSSSFYSRQTLADAGPLLCTGIVFNGGNCCV